MTSAQCYVSSLKIQAMQLLIGSLYLYQAKCATEYVRFRGSYKFVPFEVISNWESVSNKYNSILIFIVLVAMSNQKIQSNSNSLLCFFSDQAKSLHKRTPHVTPETYEIQCLASIYIINYFIICITLGGIAASEIFMSNKMRRKQIAQTIQTLEHTR